MAINIYVRCRTHKTYTGTRKPRADCAGCRDLYTFIYATKAPLEITGVGGFKNDAMGALNNKTMYIYTSEAD